MTLLQVPENHRAGNPLLTNEKLASGKRSDILSSKAPRHLPQ